MVFHFNEPVLAKLLETSATDSGIDEQVRHCRSEGKAALFDMSFLVQLRWSGKDSVEFLERILVGDIRSLNAGNCILSIITNANGGVIDDAIVTNVGDHFVMTIHDRYDEHFQEQMALFQGEVYMEYLENSIFALQGPGAAAVMAKLLPSEFDLERMAFMSSCNTLLLGKEACRVARCGFTGEDGFELHIPSMMGAFAVASKLLMDPNVLPASLQALLTLRLEAGLSAKGKELHEAVNPIEASLGWTIARRRRQEGGFVGAESLLTTDGKLKKMSRKCVGLCLSSSTYVPQERTEIFDATGCKIGVVTSAAFSPCIKEPIAMALIDTALAKPGTEVLLKTTLSEGYYYEGGEEKTYKAQVVKMPFVQTRFYKVPTETLEENKDASVKVRDPSTGEEFESPRSPRGVASVFCGSQIAKVPQYDIGAGALTKVHDPGTGEDFECPPLSI